MGNRITKFLKKTYSSNGVVGRAWRAIEDALAGHVTIGPVVVYGFNAMHVAVDIKVRGTWVCFKPPTFVFGTWWPGYFYISPDATPANSVYDLDDRLRDMRRMVKKVASGWPFVGFGEVVVSIPPSEGFKQWAEEKEATARLFSTVKVGKTTFSGFLDGPLT